MPSRLRGRKRALAYRAKKKSKRTKRRSSKVQSARIIETIKFTDINPGVNYNFQFNLSQFIRASQLAPNFKWYKAAKVEWQIEPLYNTFQDGTSGTEVTMPYYYSVMNRTQDSSILTLSDFQAMGCKPKKMISKQTMSYRPNWCSGGLNLQWFNGLTGTYESTPAMGLKAQYSYLASPDAAISSTLNGTLMSPTLPVVAPPPATTVTAPKVYTNAVVYNGHSVFIDQGVPTGTLQPVGKVTCTVHWVFKDPQCSYTAESNKVTVIQPAVDV